MISANGGLPAHRYTPQLIQRWPRGSEPASPGVGGGGGGGRGSRRGSPLSSFLPLVLPSGGCRGGGLSVSFPALPVAGRSGGLAVGRGGRQGRGGGPQFRFRWPALPSCPGPSCGPSPTTPPPLSSLSPRRVGAGGGGPGQRLVVSGPRVSGAPFCASVAPAASPTTGGACPPVVRTAGGVGGALRIGGPGPARGGVPRRWSARGQEGAQRQGGEG